MSGQYTNCNTAIGDSALKTAISNLNTIGHDNTACGCHALTSLENGRNESTAVGAFALKENVTGENTAVGAFAASSGNGTENTAVGNWALRYGSGGTSNTALGFRALAGDENSSVDPVTKPSGKKNTAVGAHTLRFSADGDDNTAIGYSVLNRIDGKTANGNTGVGSNSLKNVTSGGHNTAIGNNTGILITTGKHNTLIGNNANVSNRLAQYRTAIGSGSIATDDNTLILGRTTTDRVGIRTTSPDSIFQVGGDLNIPSVHITSGTYQPALLVDGGQRWTVATFNHLNTTYPASLHDHVVIYNGTADPSPLPLPSVLLPDPTTLENGHTFIVRNADAYSNTITTTVKSFGTVFLPYGTVSPVLNVQIESPSAGSLNSRTFIVAPYTYSCSPPTKVYMVIAQ